MRLTAVVFLASCSMIAAFAPASTPVSSRTQMHAKSNDDNTSSRREVMGAIGASLGAVLMFPKSSNAIQNPALQTFKGRKKTKGQFIPGKGLHKNEFSSERLSEDQLVALSNPALQTFKGRRPTKGAFIPGKGLHNNDYELI